MKKFLTTAALVLLLAGCSTVNVNMNNTRAARHPTFEGKNSFFFGGIAQEKDIDADIVCGKRGINQIKTYYSVADVIVSALTWGIYAPQSYELYCQTEER